MYLRTYLEKNKRKHINQEVLNQQSIQQNYLDIVANIVLALDKQFRISFLNKKGYEILEYPQGELQGKNWEALLPAEERKGIRKIFDDWVQGKSVMPVHHENDIITKRGKKRIISWYNTELIDQKGQISGTLSSGEDITERRKAEKALEENKERLEVAQRVAHVGSWEIFIKNNEVLWSKELYNIFGLQPTEKAPNISEYSKLIHPDDLKEVSTRMDRLVAEGKLGENISFDYRITKPDGSIRYLHTERMVKEINEEGKASRIVGIDQDITERKLSEEENMWMASFPQMNPEPIVEADIKGNISYTNPAANQLFPDLKSSGLKHLFFLGWEDLFHDVEEKVPRLFNREIQMNGHWYQQRIYPTPDNHCLRVYSSNIDERKKAESELESYWKRLERLVVEKTAQLKKAERLAAIGETAGMVGHDIRNPLQAMISDVYLLKEAVVAMSDSKSKQDAFESLDSIENSIGYINKIVADLQDYYKLLKPEHININLYELTLNAFRSLNIPYNVQYSFEIDPSIRLKSDPLLISRILTNLITNAIQAMPNGGKLLVGAYRIGGNASIEVTDTGVGIPEHVKDKLFTPMFTTKAKGQGLGLAVVKRLVEALNGSIVFESQEGKGAKFIIKLPLN